MIFGTYQCLLIIEVPGTSDHFLEVAVVINTTADICVVFFKLFASDNVISSLAVSIVVVLLEGRKEFLKNLALCLFAGNNIGVELAIVSAFNIVDVKVPIAVFVHLCEGLAHKL